MNPTKMFKKDFMKSLEITVDRIDNYWKLE